MPIKELTMGEELAVLVWRSDYDFQDLADACAYFEKGVRSTYSELLDLTEPPVKTPPRRRLYVLALALNLKPSDFGLKTSDRSPLWPTDKEMTDRLRSDLRNASSGCEYGWCLSLNRGARGEPGAWVAYSIT